MKTNEIYFKVLGDFNEFMKHVIFEKPSNYILEIEIRNKSSKRPIKGKEILNRLNKK